MSTILTKQALADYEALLAAKGIPLSTLGIQDVALERENALFAVELLRQAQVPILGGDVYVEQGGIIATAYANWHTDARPDDDRSRYLARSWAHTTMFITNYPSRTQEKTLFSLVLGKLVP